MLLTIKSGLVESGRDPVVKIRVSIPKGTSSNPGIDNISEHFF